MAYMSQEHKKQIATALKEVVPKSWKYSLAVRNHSSLVMTIRSADVDLIGLHQNKHSDDATYLQLNTYYLDRAYSGVVLKQMEDILQVLNMGNYDNSDVQSDYFDVGHYVNINVGNYQQPFVCTQ